MKLSRNAKKLVALTLSAALVIGGITVNGSSASAAKKATLKLNKKSAKVTVGKKVTLKVKKTNVKSAKITWKSSKKAVASVSKKGVVTGKKAGKAKISATIKYKVKGSKKTQKKTLKCTVTVVAATKAPVATKAPAPTKAPSGDATAAPTNAPTGDTTPAPTGDTTPAPTGDTTPAPTGDTTPAPTGDTTPAPTGDTTPAPTGDTTPAPTGDTTPAPTGDTTPAPTGSTTAAPTPSAEATPTPETVDAKWYSGIYSATLTKDGDNKADITDSTLDEKAAPQVKEAVSFGKMENNGEKQPALLIDCSKLVTTGLKTPAIHITVSEDCNIMYSESGVDGTSWVYQNTTNTYSKPIDAEGCAYAVYLGDKEGEVTLTVSILDAAALPEVVTKDIPATITLKPGDTTTVDLEYAANEYTYSADYILVHLPDWSTEYKGVTCQYDDTAKQLSITVPSGLDLDKTKTLVEYVRIYENADGMQYNLTVVFNHVDASIKVLKLESSWKNTWDSTLLVSPETLAAAGLTEDNLVGSKITLTNGEAGACSVIAFESGQQCKGDENWLNGNASVTVTLTAEDAKILKNGIWVGLSNEQNTAAPASVLLELVK